MEISQQTAGIKPMLCTLLKAPFNDPEYLYEVKWDGYRIIAYVSENSVRLESRSGHDYTKKYPTVVSALKKLRRNTVLDGEVVYLNKEGKPDFDALQKVAGQKAPVVFYAFDILWLDGRELMKLPLVQRKEILRELTDGNQVVKFSDHFEDGLALFEQVKAIGLEGIIAKRKNSPYVPNQRGKNWYKIPTEIRQEFVIGGWVESEANRHFRTLLFGAYDGGELKWIGHAGGGYKEHEMPKILKRLKAIERNVSPFVNEVEYEGRAHWVKPDLVANIKFATFTRSGKIRKPAIFQGFREDKEAIAVAIPEKPKVKKSKGKSLPNRERRLPATSDSNWPLVESQPIRNEEQFDIDGCTINLYNVDRELWKGTTKADLIQYYHSVSPLMLPHLKDRPLSLYVKLKGPHAKGIYIKDMEGRQPDCAEVFSTPRKHKKEGKRDVIDYLVCNNTATLLYMVNLGCIDVNPWTSRTTSPLHPDFIVIDLDPTDADFEKAIETARAAKQLFDEHKLKAFVKTSGKSGIHLFLPCSSFTFPQARKIAENICDGIHQVVPETTTTTVTVSDRGNKLYLDPNQNDYSDTVAAAYSARPYKHPRVSTPLEWKEVKQGLDPDSFTISNVHLRIQKKGDLFMGCLDKRIASQNDKNLKRFV